jgi:Zn-dependent protease with chaperone function
VSFFIRKPKYLVLEDFQRPIDRDYLVKFLQWDESNAADWIDGKILRPFCDDLAKRDLSVNAVELGPKQRADIFNLVVECAAILQMPVPKVYIKPEGHLNASAGGLVDPILMLDSRFLKPGWSDRQLRAVIGHELGHIKCRHTKLQLLTELAVNHLPKALSPVLLLAQLKWSREAEMSADNAGMICCQDPAAYEHLLICLLLECPPDDVKDIDIENFIKQRSEAKVSMYAEGVQLLSEFTRSHPFIADRILQLREYTATEQFQNIWTR